MTPKNTSQKQIIQDIEKRLGDLEINATYELKPAIKAIQKDVEELKKGAEVYVLVKDFKPFADSIIWTVRIVVAAVIMAVLAIAFGKTTK